MGPLLAVPNFYEGRDRAAVERISAAAARAGARILDVHLDPDHHRSVLSLAAAPGALAEALLASAGEALALIDLRRHRGGHPRIGAIDVAPIVYREPGERGAACAEALVLGDLLAGELALPVFLYGALAGGRTRAELRRGGSEELARRMAAGELSPDFGPRALSPRAGAVLVTARPPLIAFNLELEPPATVDRAREIAALIREGGGEGMPGVRAIGLRLESTGAIQVSTNIEDHRRASPAEVLEAVRRHAPVASCELVGLAPGEALAGLPGELVRNRRTIEEALEGS